MQRDKCGCRSSDSAWLTLCPTHEQEWRERHVRAQAEYEALQIERDLISSAPAVHTPKE